MNWNLDTAILLIRFVLIGNMFGWLVVFVWGHLLFKDSKFKHEARPPRRWCGSMAFTMMMGLISGINSVESAYGLLSHASINMLNCLILPLYMCSMSALSSQFRLAHNYWIINIVPFVTLAALMSIFPDSLLMANICMLYVLGYSLYSFTHLFFSVKNYEETIKHLYSSMYGQSMRWIYHFIWIGIIFLLIYILRVCMMMVYTQILFYIAMFVFFNYGFWCAYHMIITRERMYGRINISSEEDGAISTAGEQDPIIIPSGKLRMLGDRLHQVCVEERLYTIESVTRDEVARHMNIDPDTLTRVLHQYEHCSFYDYINALRIDEAKLLLSQPGAKLQDVVKRVGFTDIDAYKAAKNKK